MTRRRLVGVPFAGLHPLHVPDVSATLGLVRGHGVAVAGGGPRVSVLRGTAPSTAPPARAGG